VNWNGRPEDGKRAETCRRGSIISTFVIHDFCVTYWLHYSRVRLTTISHKDGADNEINAGRTNVVMVCTSQIMQSCWLASIVSDPIAHRSLHYSTPSPTAGVAVMKKDEAGKTKCL